MICLTGRLRRIFRLPHADAFELFGALANWKCDEFFFEGWEESLHGLGVRVGVFAERRGDGRSAGEHARVTGRMRFA